MSCITCKVETNKYKCPNCLEFYCSLDCCKIHKENKCEPKIITKVDDPAETEESSSKTILFFKTADTVELQRLESLKNSEGLKNLLYNPHLRTLLKEIDEAPNAWKAMKVAMQEPLFIEFADECLKVVEPHAEDD